MAPCSCVCCTVRGDLIKALKDLMKRGKKFDHVLIETTGLADPAPVAFVRPRRLRILPPLLAPPHLPSPADLLH